MFFAIFVLFHSIPDQHVRENGDRAKQIDEEAAKPSIICFVGFRSWILDCLLQIRRKEGKQVNTTYTSRLGNTTLSSFICVISTVVPGNTPPS
jgi:hypothetical protein